MLEALSTISVCFALLLIFGWLIRDNGPNIPKRGWWNVNEDGTYRDTDYHSQEDGGFMDELHPVKRVH